VGIARDVAELCPSATVLDLANPMAPVCRAMVREAGVRVVGLCEAWKLSLPLFTAALGVAQEELELTSVGTNHLGFALSLLHGGREVLPEALAWLESEAGREVLESAPVARDIYRAFGLWPTGTEDHIAEWFPYFLTPQTNGGADYHLSTRHVTAEQWRERFDERRQMATGARPVSHLLRPSGESVVPIMLALLGMEPPALETVNLPNAGLIDNLPPEAIVELPALVSPTGVRGLKVGPLPPAIAALLSLRATQHELMVDAALSGDRDTALRGILLDAQVTSLAAARDILARSLEVNAEWLPRFWHLPPQQSR
jgi:alpha-galactosidase